MYFNFDTIYTEQLLKKYFIILLPPPLYVNNHTYLFLDKLINKMINFHVSK
jgi:hypothetical protein